MKNFIFAAVAVACSVLFISCDAEPVLENELQSKKLECFSEKVVLPELDSIPKNYNATMGDSEGPDDEVFPITPPKKK